MKSSSSSSPPDPLPGDLFNPYRRFRVACVPEPLLRSRLVSVGAKLAYAQLARNAGKDGRCFPKQSTLAAALGVSERQIRRYIRELEKAALLRTIRRGLNDPNAYEFLWHPIFEKAQIAVRPAAKTLILQDRTSMSDQDRTHTSVQERTSAAGPLKEEESPLRESVNREEHPLDRSSESVRFAAADFLEPARKRHLHRRAVKAWPAEDVAEIRAHLEDLPIQDGSKLEATDELVGRLLNAMKVYLRTSFELGALLYRLGNRIRSRPTWWPESARSAPAWLLAAIDTEYASDFIAARKPTRQEVAAPPSNELSATSGRSPDPEFVALISQIAASKALR